MATVEAGVRLEVQNQTNNSGNGFNSMAGNPNSQQMGGVQNNPGSMGTLTSQSMREVTVSLKDNLISLDDAVKKVIDSFKVLNEQVTQRNNSPSVSGGSHSSDGENFFKGKAFGLAQLGFNTGIQTISSWDSAQTGINISTMNGDLMGAEVQKKRQQSSAVKGISGGLMAAGAMMGWNPVGWAMMGLGAIGEVAGLIMDSNANQAEEDKAKVDIYEAQLPAMSKMLASYGDSYLNQKNYVQLAYNGNRYAGRRRTARSYASPSTDLVYDGRGEWDQQRLNNKLAIDMYDATRAYARNTNLETGTFINYASSLSQNGISDFYRGMGLTSLAGRSAVQSNGNIQNILDFVGTVERYGGNGERALLKAQDSKTLKIDPTQLEEVLNGVRTSIEDGVSKGYTRNAEDLVDTLSMFTNASGGSAFWTGKNGMERIQQMQNGLASMGNLDSTDSMITFAAMKKYIEDPKNLEKILNDDKVTGYDEKGNPIISKGKQLSYLDGYSYHNVVAAIESGTINEGTFNAINKGVTATYKNDRDSIIEAYKNIFGLNTEGAIQLYNMKDNFKEDEFKTMLKDSSLTSGETQKQNVTNELKDEVVKLGSELDKIWEKPQSPVKDISAIKISVQGLVKQQTWDNIIKFYESESELSGRGALKENFLPYLYKAAADEADIDPYIKFTNQYMEWGPAKTVALANMTPQLKNGFWGSKGDIDKILKTGDKDWENMTRNDATPNIAQLGLYLSSRKKLANANDLTDAQIIDYVYSHSDEIFEKYDNNKNRMLDINEFNDENVKDLLKEIKGVIEKAALMYDNQETSIYVVNEKPLRSSFLTTGGSGAL